MEIVKQYIVEVKGNRLLGVVTKEGKHFIQSFTNQIGFDEVNGELFSGFGELIYSDKDADNMCSSCNCWKQKRNSCS